MAYHHREGFTDALALIKSEMQRSVDKYGPISSDPHRALAVVVKELGEVAEAVNDLTRLSVMPNGDPGARRDRIAHLESELAQVAQSCIQLIMRLEEAK